jgi:hypothetical protein
MEDLELTTVSINNKLLDVYYSIFDVTEIKIEAVKDASGNTNIFEFLNDLTKRALYVEVKSLHMEVV